jgi:hypothetical protein
MGAGVVEMPFKCVSTYVKAMGAYVCGGLNENDLINDILIMIYLKIIPLEIKKGLYIKDYKNLMYINVFFASKY